MRPSCFAFRKADVLLNPQWAAASRVVSNRRGMAAGAGTGAGPGSGVGSGSGTGSGAGSGSGAWSGSGAGSGSGSGSGSALAEGDARAGRGRRGRARRPWRRTRNRACRKRAAEGIGAGVASFCMRSATVSRRASRICWLTLACSGWGSSSRFPALAVISAIGSLSGGLTRRSWSTGQSSSGQPAHEAMKASKARSSSAHTPSRTADSRAASMTARAAPRSRVVTR